MVQLNINHNDAKCGMNYLLTSESYGLHNFLKFSMKGKCEHDRYLQY